MHSGIYRYLGAAHRDPDGVPVELAFDHGYPGLGVVVVEPAPGTTRDELQATLDATATALFPSDPRVDMVASFGVLDTEASRARDAAPASRRCTDRARATGRSEPRARRAAPTIASCSSPSSKARPTTRGTGSARYADAIAGTERGTVTFAAPFFAAVVGTDTYLDELW